VNLCDNLVTENEISNIIIGCAIEIHRSLGPGLLESAYRACLHYELIEKGLIVVCEKPMPVIYKAVKLDQGYRMDLVVENKVVVELKRVEAINEVHIAQLLTYLKLGNYRLGLIINFQTKLLKQGIKRIII
jgi:GxxExxY protein